MTIMEDTDGLYIVQVRGNLETYYFTGITAFGLKQSFYQKILDLYDEYEEQEDPKEAITIRCDIAVLEKALLEVMAAPFD